MTVTTINSGFDPQICSDAIMAAIPNLPLFKNTGVVATKTGLGVGSGVIGTLVTVPYFNTIGKAQIISDGTAGTPVELTSSNEQSPLQRLHKSVELTVAAQHNGLDVNGETAQLLVSAIQEAIHDELITLAQRNNAGEWDSFTYDQSVNSAGTFTYDSFVEAVSLFGACEDIACLVVAPSVLKQVKLLKDTTGRPLFEKGDPSRGMLPSIDNVPVLASDAITPTANVYTNLLFRKNSMVSWLSDISDMNLETQRDILRYLDIFAVNSYIVNHRYKRLPGSSKPGVVHLKTK